MFDGSNLAVRRQRAANKLDGQVAELERLRAQLAQTLNGGLQASAIAKGALKVARTIIEEQRAEQSGQRDARRLSDPSNVVGRNQALAAVATTELSKANVNTKPGYQADLANSRKLK